MNTEPFSLKKQYIICQNKYANSTLCISTKISMHVSPSINDSKHAVEDARPSPFYLSSELSI